MDRLNNSCQAKSDPPRRRIVFGCALKADNLLPADLYKTYRTTKKTIVPKIPNSATRPKPAPVSAYHPKNWNCNAISSKPGGSEKSYEYQPRVVKKPSLKQIRRTTTPVAQRKVENLVVAADHRGSSAKENRLVVCGDTRLVSKQLPTAVVASPQFTGPMLYKSRPINVSDYSENSEIEISSWSPIFLEKGTSKFFLTVGNPSNAMQIQSTAEKNKYARRTYRMAHYPKKCKPKISSELVARGIGYENPPRKAKKPQPSFRTYYNYSQHLINQDKKSDRPQPAVLEQEIEKVSPEKTPKPRRTRNPVVSEMLSQWVSNYLPTDNANNSNILNIKGGSWIALSKTDIHRKHSKQPSVKKISENQRMYKQEKISIRNISNASKKKVKCRARTYSKYSATVDNFSSDQSRRNRECKKKKNCSSANSTNNSHNLVVCRFGTWRKYSKPRWNNIWTRAARRCGGLSKSLKHNCGHPMRQGKKVMKSIKTKGPVSKSYIDKKLEELTKKHVQKQKYGSVKSSSLESKDNNSNATSSGSNRATIGSSEVSSMTQSSQINVQTYHSQQASPTGTLNDVSGASCKLVRGESNSNESTCASCTCMKKPSRTEACECARTANVGTSNVELKPTIKKLVESITNNQAVFQQTNVVTKIDQERASQKASKKSMQLTVPRERTITLKKYNTEVISVPVFCAPQTNHSCATIPCTRLLKFTEPNIVSISSNCIKKKTISSATSKSLFVSAETQVERHNIESSDDSEKSVNSPCRQSSTLVPVPSLPKQRLSRARIPGGNRSLAITSVRAMTVQRKASVETPQYSRPSSPNQIRKSTNIQALNVQTKTFIETQHISGPSSPCLTQKETDFQTLAVLESPLPREVNKYNIRAEKYKSTTILVPNVEKPPPSPPKKRKPDEISRIYYSPRQKPKTVQTTLAITESTAGTSVRLEDEISSALQFSTTFPSSASYPKVVICRSGSWRRRPPWRKMWTKAVKGVTFWTRTGADGARKKAIKPENVIIIDQEMKENNNSNNKSKPSFVCQHDNEPVTAQIKNMDQLSKIINKKPDTEKNSLCSDVIKITNLDKLPKSALSTFRPSKANVKGHFPSGGQFAVESGAGSGNIQITFAGTDPIHALSDENNRAVQISNKDDSMSVDASIGGSDHIRTSMKISKKQLKAPIVDREDQFSLISIIQKTKSLVFDDTENISVSDLTCQLSMSTLDTIKANDSPSPKSLLKSGERRWSITEPKLLSISSAELKCATMVTSTNNGYNTSSRGIQVEKKHQSEGIQVENKRQSNEIQTSSQSPVNTETVQSLIDYLATTTGRKGTSSNPQSISDRLEGEERKPPSNNISLNITLNTNSKTYSETPQVGPGSQALVFPKKKGTSSSLSPLKWINADDKEQSSYISEDVKASAVTKFITNAATQYSTPAFKNIWHKIDERRVLNCSVQTSRESRHFLYGNPIEKLFNLREKQNEERKVYHCSVQTPNNSYQSYNVEADQTLRLSHKRSARVYPARCIPNTSWRSTKEQCTGISVKTQTEIYAVEKCPKCRTKVMKFGSDDDEDDERMDRIFKNPVISSCQYYTTMFCKRFEQFKETLVRQYTMKRTSPSSSESNTAISQSEEHGPPMIQESSHTSTTTEIQTQKTKLYGSKDDTFLYSMRISNCTTKTDYLQLQTNNLIAVSPRASSSCCELGSNMCSMDMSGEHNRKNLNYVYYLFTAIEGRIRRII